MTNFRELYRDVRNHLAGQHLGSTRDEALMHQVIMALLCKSDLDSKRTAPSGPGYAAQYRSTWAKLRRSMPNLLSHLGELSLDDFSLEYLHSTFAEVNLRSGDHDPLGDLYEVFTGSLARGQEGQFFTPPNAVDLLVRLVGPRPDEVVLDPASGAGSFLGASAREFIRQGHAPEAAARNLYGIDKDSFLARLAALRLTLLTGEEANVVCGDSLAWRSQSSENLPLRSESSVDVILTNPPFGSKIIATDRKTQGQFDLGHKWKRDGVSGQYQRTDELARSLSPQVAFVERCLGLLRPNGRLGMVVPESLLSSQRYRHVVDYIRARVDIRAVVGMPESLFKTSGSGGTHTKTCLVVAQKVVGKRRPISIFMAETRWCGNDSRGRREGPDELPEVARRYTIPKADRPADHLSYEVTADELVDNIMAPRYYDPEPKQMLQRLQQLTSS